jgi:ABC-type phosphate transport system substrate-binding protein
VRHEGRQLSELPPDEFSQVLIGYRVLAVIVHPTNKIAERGMRLSEIRWAYAEREKSDPSGIPTWGRLGLTGDWQDQRIVAYGVMGPASSAVALDEDVMRGVSLRTGDDPVIETRPAAIVSAVAENKYAIGYVLLTAQSDTGGIGLRTKAVKIVPLIVDAVPEKKPSAPVLPDSETIANGRYPLARKLVLAFRKGEKAEQVELGVKSLLNDHLPKLLANECFISARK